MNDILQQENLISLFENNEATNLQLDLEDEDISEFFLSEHWWGTIKQGAKPPNACIRSCDQLVTPLEMYPVFAHMQVG